MNDENSPLARQEMDILGRVVWRYIHEEGGQQRGGGELWHGRYKRNVKLIIQCQKKYNENLNTIIVRLRVEISAVSLKSVYKHFWM